LGVLELVPTTKAVERFVAFDEKTIKSPIEGLAGSRLAKSGAVEFRPIETCSAPGHWSCAWAN
jgi:hypothetical protein